MVLFRHNSHHRQRVKAVRAFFVNQRVLCSWPIFILIVIASLDNADKQMLNSSFPIFEKVLGWNAYQLGNFSLVSNLSYALSLPVWGWMIYKYSDIKSLQKLLACACGVWGIATIAIAALAKASDISAPSHLASSLSRNLQIVARCINGIALGSIMPLSQSLLAEYVPANLLGQAFGMLSVGEKLAGTLSSTFVVWFGDSWYCVYYALGVTSLTMGLVSPYMSSHVSKKNNNNNFAKQQLMTIDPYEIKKKTHETNTTTTDKDVESRRQSDHVYAQEKVLSFRQIIHRIVRLPSFLCLVAQGVFGGTPWDMMSFLLLLMDWRGFTKDQIVMLQITSGISSMVGGWFGGVMGDYCATNLSFGGKTGGQGRILLALVSVLLGIPFYGLHLFATNYYWALLWMNLFQLTATWVPSAACRPICVELTNGPSERAQIVALWIVLEKISGALFGAPLVGYLTSTMLTSSDENNNNNNNDDDVVGNKEKAQVLAFNLFILSGLFWGICASFWFVMLRVIQRK